jgi:DNA polymerase-3 subunit chi
MSKDHKPRIDFYKLRSQSKSGIDRFCCQLADKVVQMGKPVFVLTNDAARTRLLDDIMWTFSDSSFVPHDIQGDTDDVGTTVIIGHEKPVDGGYLLINMSEKLPPDLTMYERVAEIINEEARILQQGRARYSHYKSDGYPLHYHEINS